VPHNRPSSIFLGYIGQLLFIYFTVPQFPTFLPLVAHARKIETSRPTRKEDQCPFKINIRLNLKDDLFYLCKKGSVASRCGHGRRSVIFTRADQIDKNMEKMMKDFEVANVKPSTASSVLHQIDDRIYDPKVISNMIAKAQKTWLSYRGINTKAVSAQILVEYLTVSPDTSCLFLIRDPDST
jgi:hypothetical protein